MFVPWKLFKQDGLLLPSYPAATLLGAQQVHGAVTVAVHHRGLDLWELVGVLECFGCGEAAAVQTVDGHARGLQIHHQRLCVLPHHPAILKADVFVETFVVQHSVVDSGRLYQNLTGGG